MSRKRDDNGVNLALAAAATARHVVTPAKRYIFNKYHLNLIKMTFITTGDRPPSYRELAIELADLSGHPQDVCERRVRQMSSGEGWTVKRNVYWEELAQRALEKEGNASLRSFERKLRSLGETALDISMRALLVLEPTSVTEAVLLGKFGMELVYRSQRQPARLSRFYGDPDGDQNQARTIEAEFQEASKEDYAATADAVLAKLAPASGSGPAPAQRHQG